MHYRQLSRNIAKWGTQKAIEKSLFDFIRANNHIIIEMVSEQLFVDSIDYEGLDLGFYGKNIKQFDPSKSPGEPFTMISSGGLKKGLFVIVTEKEIIIGSSTPDIEDILNNPVFDSNRFFGLTGDNLRKLKREHLTPYLAKWIKGKLKSPA